MENIFKMGQAIIQCFLKPVRLLFFVTTFFAVSTSAHAADAAYDAELFGVLLPSCNAFDKKGDENTTKQIECLAFIRGIAYGIQHTKGELAKLKNSAIELENLNASPPTKQKERKGNKDSMIPVKCRSEILLKDWNECKSYLAELDFQTLPPRMPSDEISSFEDSLACIVDSLSELEFGPQFKQPKNLDELSGLTILRANINCAAKLLSKPLF